MLENYLRFIWSEKCHIYNYPVANILWDAKQQTSDQIYKGSNQKLLEHGIFIMKIFTKIFVFLYY